MNSCQAARQRSRSFYVFDAICTSVYVVSVIDVCGCDWILCWTEIEYQFGVWQGWETIVYESIGVTHEGKYRDTFMNQIKNR